MELYAGLDLHSRNTYIGIMDKEFNRVFKKRVPNHLEHILQTLDPFQNQIKGFVVESTYNWYWLVDDLMDAGYSSAHLANPAAIKQYEGLKHSDDQHDAFFLAQLLILGILPRGIFIPRKIDRCVIWPQADVLSPAQDGSYSKPAIINRPMLCHESQGQ